jgi:hypothetical protein
MGTIVGSRRNVNHSGTTAGSCLMECLKSMLKDVPLLATADKHAMMGGARVADESRVSASTKGFLARKNYFNTEQFSCIFNSSACFFESASHSDTLQHVFLRPRCSRDGAHGLVHPEPESLRRDHSSISPQGCPAAYSILPVNPGSPA